MQRRPDRPDDQFLDRIGIFHLPETIDLSFRRGSVWYDFALEEVFSDRAFLVTKVDDKGRPALSTAINAFEKPGRTKADIWAELHAALVSFGATPLIHRPKRPTEEALRRFGVSSLPPNVDLSVVNAHIDAAIAFVVEARDTRGLCLKQEFISARETRANPAPKICGQVHRALLGMGATPLHGFPLQP